MNWTLGIGIYTGILIGFWSGKYEDGNKHCIYLPFVFIEFNTFYD
jgi:hypothetical protein